MQPSIDSTKPNAARIYDFLLGGKDHFAVDRETASQLIRAWPATTTTARENRAFLGRAVRYLVAEAGVRQFLDIGTGLPSANNVHEVAQQVAPECRVVYVDNDPVVMAHARALLTSSPEGRTAYIQADLRDPARILQDPATRAVLDLGQPVALMLLAIVHFITDEEKPCQLVSTLMDALPPGSYLALSHVTGDFYWKEATEAEIMGTWHQSGVTMCPRTAERISAIALDGLEPVSPGLVSVSEWRPDSADPPPPPAEVNLYGAVARKP
ncbi:MAG TPA: SAM-dependent methyltransferase [Streptosporangiaceae bacterium]|nr:SAM-dependent methyltransferase [Streptosporangiaceae bacterium]